jgi:hypothetical protein
MGRAAHELDALRDAADSALTGLVDALLTAQDAGAAPRQVVVVGPAAPNVTGPGGSSSGKPPTWPLRREHPGAAGPVDFREFGLPVDLPALPGAAEADAGPPLPTPLLVARYLVSRLTGRSEAEDRLWASARWVTVDALGGARLGADLAASASPVALLLMADGAACHGPKAPRAEDSRAGAYDRAVADALSAGDAAALAALDPALGTELSATGPVLWPLLTAAAAETPWTAKVLHHSAPYGVGWIVALWRRQGRL